MPSCSHWVGGAYDVSLLVRAFGYNLKLGIPEEPLPDGVSVIGVIVPHPSVSDGPAKD
jgi:hypothetical protein